MNGLDIFNVYVMGSIEMLTVFHFYNRFLRKKAGMLSYFLFVFLGMAIMLFPPANGGITLLLYVLLLVAGGFYRSRMRSVLIILYAVVTVAIMHLCYGISHSLSYMLASFVLPKNPQISGFVLMVMSSLVALLMSVLCYLVIDKKFSCEKTMETKYGLLLLIPSLLVGGVGEYIDFNSYGNTIVTEMDGKLTAANPLPVLTIQLFGIASLFCMMFVYKRLVETFERNKELSLLELEKHSLKQKKAEKCTTNTDKVDREIEKLKEEKKQLEQQIKAAAGEEEKVKEWKKKLAQIEMELSWKDNDTYRRQNSVTY